MTDARRSVLIGVTRRLPSAVERELSEHYTARLNNDDRPFDRAALIDAMRQFDVLVTTITDRIDADMLGAVGIRVKLIANFGAGIDHIDLVAARDAGVAVTNTPDALTDATAELAILLMLMAARRAGEGEREVRAAAWNGWCPTHLIGMGLKGRVLGLIGFGRIAQATAARALGLGMTIRYYNRTAGHPETEAELRAERVSCLEELASVSDVVSLHVPGGPATRHMVDGKFLSKMKSNAILVNTARGSVVNEEALSEALASGAIAGAALDVYEHEPAIYPGLLSNKRVVLLPHLGSSTTEARTAMGMQAVSNINAFVHGSDLLNRVA